MIKIFQLQLMFAILEISIEYASHLFLLHLSPASLFLHLSLQVMQIYSLDHRWVKALKTSLVAPNKLERKFKDGNPNQIFLTDITYLTYDMNKRAYLSGIKDGVTNEIHAYKLSKSLDITFVEDTMSQLEVIQLDPNPLINSDQGAHYTSHVFQRCLKTLGIEQSMSRRGNCWDNAPIESFFGHMKDEINLVDCKTFEEVEKTIDDYVDIASIA